jgi:ferric-dicitrate binding protein FerR (iron transport regulator)
MLDRYFSGECTPEEASAIEQWVSADGARAELVGFMREVWEEAGRERPEIDEDAGWQALRARIAETRNGPAVVRPLRVAPLTLESTRRRGGRVARVAAAVAGLAAAAVVTVWWAGMEPSVPEPVVAGAAREYVTTRGQRAEVMLVDGTRVWLSVGSRLNVPPSYGARARDVELEGEAFFVVQHDAARPFRVHTPGAVSEDLGTEFSVRAYPGDTSTVVIVASGAVALQRAELAQAGDRGVELTRGQMGRLDPSGLVTVTDGVDLHATLGWREGRLEFDERPLAEAITELERWYDVHITLGDSVLARVPLTASFSDQTVDQALAIIAATLDVRYQRDGRQVRLMAKRASR